MPQRLIAFLSIESVAKNCLFNEILNPPPKKNKKQKQNQNKTKTLCITYLTLQSVCGGCSRENDVNIVGHVCDQHWQLLWKLCSNRCFIKEHAKNHHFKSKFRRDTKNNERVRSVSCCISERTQFMDVVHISIGKKVYHQTSKL